MLTIPLEALVIIRVNFINEDDSWREEYVSTAVPRIGDLFRMQHKLCEVISVEWWVEKSGQSRADVKCVE